MPVADTSTIFKTIAVIYGISAPGHLVFGVDAVYPALSKIPMVGKNAIGRRGAENCWNYVAVGLMVSACLNWQWARTGGPQSLEENIIFWAITAIHGVNGFRYFQVGAYSPLASLWLGPILSIYAKRLL